ARPRTRRPTRRPLSRSRPAGRAPARAPGGASPTADSSPGPHARMAAGREIVLGVLFGGILAASARALAALLQRAQGLQSRMRLAQLFRSRIDGSLEIQALRALGLDRLVELAAESRVYRQAAGARQGPQGGATVVPMALAILLQRLQRAARLRAGLFGAGAAGGGQIAIAVGHLDEFLEHSWLHVLASSVRSGACRSGSMPSPARAASDDWKSHCAERSWRRKRPIAGATEMARSISGSDPGM